MITQSQELKQTQRLSPIQIATIKLIESPVQELEQKIRDELDSNPAIEADYETKDENEKDIDIDDLRQDDGTPSYKIRSERKDEMGRSVFETLSVRESFLQNLSEQLGCREMTPGDREIAQFMVGSLGADGYLRRDLDSLVDDMAFNAGINAGIEDAERVLKVIQSLDPPGVGARDLRECLLLQLRAMRPSRDVEDAVSILEDCFEEYAARQFPKVRQMLDIDEDRLKAAKSRITSLNPYPGGQIDDDYTKESQQVIPDFVYGPDRAGGSEITLQMPRVRIPEIKINPSYAEMYEDARRTGNKDVLAFIKQKVDSAHWFVDAIKQRQTTLRRTMEAIIEFQKDFFATGDEADIKPLILETVAKKAGYDISTISRVVGSKYIETQYGVFPLKFFFSEGLKNSEGETVSTREIRKVLREIVDAESKSAPLTDEQLVSALKSKGYNIARRTIAKYREQLGIPHARFRKEI